MTKTPAQVTSIDINADIGEGSGFDGDLLEIVSSASVACGFHAGDPSTMIATAIAATARGVTLGAHPSYADRDNFGRSPRDATPADVSAAVAYQLGAMEGVCSLAGAGVSYVKLHGALYNQAATDPSIADAVLEALAAWISAPGSPTGSRRSLPILCPSASQLAVRASSFGVEVFGEAFADRAYNSNGTLVDRRADGALVRDPADVARRVTEMLVEGTVEAVDGSRIAISADSICVHGDTPGAVDLAWAVRRAAESVGVEIRPFAVRDSSAVLPPSAAPPYPAEQGRLVDSAEQARPVYPSEGGLATLTSKRPSVR